MDDSEVILYLFYLVSVHRFLSWRVCMKWMHTPMKWMIYTLVVTVNR